MELTIWHYFAAFHTIWGIFACKWLYSLFYGGGLEFLYKDDPEFAKNYEPFRRKDIQGWNKVEIVLGAIFLLPYRFAMTIFTMVLCGIFCFFLTLGTNLEKELPYWRRLLIRAVTATTARILLYSCGVFYLERKYHKITDFDPTYPKEFLDRKPTTQIPIAVSNHITYFDIYYYLLCRHNPCFLAMSGIKSWPIIGWVARCRQAVFVNREDRSAKDAVIDLIKTRVHDIQEGKQFPPMIIFPEGTVCDGSAVLQFKKGAFVTLSPVRVFALEYPRKRFNPAFDNMNLLVNYMIMQCHFYHRMRIHDIGVYYPDHLNLKDENDWEKYANKVRDIIAKCLNVPTVPLSYKEAIEYKNYLMDLKEKLKKERSTKKTD